MFLAYAEQGLVVCFFIANKRAVRFDDDVVLFAVFDAGALLAPRVELCSVRRVVDKSGKRDVPRSGSQLVARPCLLT